MNAYSHVPGNSIGIRSINLSLTTNKSYVLLKCQGEELGRKKNEIYWWWRQIIFQFICHSILLPLTLHKPCITVLSVGKVFSIFSPWKKSQNIYHIPLKMIKENNRNNRNRYEICYLLFAYKGLPILRYCPSYTSLLSISLFSSFGILKTTRCVYNVYKTDKKVSSRVNCTWYFFTWIKTW